MGKDGFVWWYGVVEDRDDPLTLGRARVRIFAWHTEDLSELPTEHLPWAHTLTPPGMQPTPPRPGDWVVGFFLDGELGQEPVIMGVISGYRRREPKQILTGSNG